VLERYILGSPDRKTVVEALLTTPSCVGNATKSRCAIVLASIGGKVLLAPVTRSGGQSIFEIQDITEDGRMVFLPIYRNTLDYGGRLPVHTEQEWRSKLTAYQSLVPAIASLGRLRSDHHVTRTITEYDFSRVLSEMVSEEKIPCESSSLPAR
jgi:hypothetical protein